MQRWRLVLQRAALDVAMSQRLVLDGWERAATESGLPVAGLEGARGKPKIALAAPLAPTIPGEAELLDIWLVERTPRWRVREALSAATPDGWTVVNLFDVWLGEAALPGRVTASVFRATLDPADAPRSLAFRHAAASMLAAASLPRERQKGEATVAYDLRPFLADITVAVGVDGVPLVRLVLRHDPERGIGRPEEALAALADLAGGAPIRVRSLVRERLVLDDPVPEPGPARRSRPGTGRARGDQRGGPLATGAPPAR